MAKWNRFRLQVRQTHRYFWWWRTEINDLLGREGRDDSEFVCEQMPPVNKFLFLVYFSMFCCVHQLLRLQNGFVMATANGNGSAHIADEYLIKLNSIGAKKQKPHSEQLHRVRFLLFAAIHNAIRFRMWMWCDVRSMRRNKRRNFVSKLDFSSLSAWWLQCQCQLASSAIDAVHEYTSIASIKRKRVNVSNGIRWMAVDHHQPNGEFTQHWSWNTFRIEWQPPDAQLPPQWPAESSRTFSQKWLTWTVNTRMVFMCDVPTVDECIPSFLLIKWWTQTLMANRVTEANFHRQITKSFSIKIDSPSASRMHTLRLVHPSDLFASHNPFNENRAQKRWSSLAPQLHPVPLCRLISPFSI